MILGYNTNGFAHHRLNDAIDIIAELGYQGVALTPDVHHLDPLRDLDVLCQAEDRMSRQGLRCVIETGARFLLNPRQKHQPTLLSPDEAGRKERFEFLKLCITVAEVLKAPCISFWSGTALEPEDRSTRMQQLSDSCLSLAEIAANKGIRIAFEPEPGMFIDTMDDFADLHSRVNHPAFGLTLDIGHLICNGELPVSKIIRQWRHVLWNVHIEDMRPGVHDHIMFGEGSVDFADLFEALKAIDFQGMLSVELSRHSHDAVNTARKSIAFLQQFCR